MQAGREKALCAGGEQFAYHPVVVLARDGVAFRLGQPVSDDAYNVMGFRRTRTPPRTPTRENVRRRSLGLRPIGFDIHEAPGRLAPQRADSFAVGPQPMHVFDAVAFSLPVSAVRVLLPGGDGDYGESCV
jgi:hypothetical protein